VALTQETRRLYNALINSGNIRYDVLPDGAAAITLTAKAAAWTYGAWVQIVASVGAADVWLVGVAMASPSNTVADYDVDIGAGAAAAEVHLAEVPHWGGMIFLPFPVLVAATTRLAGRTRSSSGLADTVDTKVIVISGA